MWKVFGLFLCLFGYALSINEVCRTNGIRGTCQRFEDCPYAQELVRNHSRFAICSFEGLIPVVCCLNVPKPSTSTAASTQLAAIKQPSTSSVVELKEELLSVQKCVDYYPKPIYPIFIAGGQKSLPRQFPHMALIGFGNETDKQWLCGGSLVSRKFVLTAGHCLFSRDFGEAKFVHIGDLDLSTDKDEAEPQDFTIVRIIAHPDYKPPVKYHDIALVELDRNINLSPFASPACLQTTRVLNATIMTASGWGQTDFASDNSQFLLNVNLKEVGFEECNSSYSDANRRFLPNGIIDDIQICAGGVVGKDTCGGDSGGPLQAENSERSFLTRVHTVIGVTSFGKACGLSGSPGVYARVSYYIKWIESIIWANGQI